MKFRELYAHAEELAESAINRRKDPLACFLLTENIVMLAQNKQLGGVTMKGTIPGGTKINQADIPKQPPVDNDHVAEGCEQFGE